MVAKQIAQGVVAAPLGPVLETQFRQMFNGPSLGKVNP